jgi:uncharacterized protein (DUF952 family)
MGSWGVGVLDNDDAWGFVDELLDTASEHRVPRLIAALERVLQAERIDVEESSGALVAALVVALARGPMNFPDERSRLVEHADRVADASGFEGLVGELRPLRTAKVARLALSAIGRVGADSELAELWEGQAEFQAALDMLTTSLRSPVRRLSAQPREPSTSPFRRGWQPGTLMSIDLGNGYRSCAQMLVEPFVAFYEARTPLTDPPPMVADIIAGTVLFTVGVNSFMDRPDGWRTIGTVSRPEDVLPRPPMFRQDLADPEKCTLIRSDDDWCVPVPITPRECIGLENASVAGWYPENCEQRLRSHHAGVPDVTTENYRVRISRSWVRVCSAQEADDAQQAGRFPAAARADESRVAFYLVDWIAHFAAGYGPGRDDLVVLEVDEAQMNSWVDRGPVLPDEATSPRVPWVHWIPDRAIIARHDLVPLDTGRYELASPWAPIFP